MYENGSEILKEGREILMQFSSFNVNYFDNKFHIGLQ